MEGQRLLCLFVWFFLGGKIWILENSLRKRSSYSNGSLLKAQTSASVIAHGSTFGLAGQKKHLLLVESLFVILGPEL